MSDIKLNYHKTHFLTSAPDIRALPEDSGIEIAFAGRSNAGKSTALNALTNQKSLARTSKTPGRTQLINLFEVEPQCRLVDLPGYGYAAVPEQMKIQWQKALGEVPTKTSMFSWRGDLNGYSSSVERLRPTNDRMGGRL